MATWLSCCWLKRELLSNCKSWCRKTVVNTVSVYAYDSFLLLSLTIRFLFMLEPYLIAIAFDRIHQDSSTEICTFSCHIIKASMA